MIKNKGLKSLSVAAAIGLASLNFNCINVYASESKPIQEARAKIDHITMSLKSNYLGLKNQSQWEEYIKEAYSLIDKISYSIVADELEDEVQDRENLVKALARINQVEKSMTPKEEGGFGNALIPKNVPQWNEYIELAEIDLKNVNRTDFPKQSKELENRLEAVKVKVEGIDQQGIIQGVEEKVAHLTWSLKNNYLGLKNQPTWEGYIDKARNLNNKVKDTNVSKKLEGQIVVRENLVKASARVNHLEKSMTSNALIPENVPQWNEYLELANKDLAKVDKKEFSKQVYELEGRLKVSKNKIQDIVDSPSKEIDAIIKRILAKDTTVANTEIGKLMSDNSILAAENNQKYLKELFKLTKEKLSTKAEVQKVIVDVNTKVNVENEKQAVIKKILAKDKGVTINEITKLLDSSGSLVNENLQGYLEELFKLTETKLNIPGEVSKVIDQVNIKIKVEKERQAIIEKILSGKVDDITIEDIGKLLPDGTFLDKGILDKYLDELKNLSREQLNDKEYLKDVINKVNDSIKIDKEKLAIIEKILSDKKYTVTTEEISILSEDKSILKEENREKYIDELSKLTKIELNSSEKVKKVITDVNIKVNVENEKQAVIKKILAKDKGVTIGEIGKLLDSTDSLVNENLEGYLEELFKLTEEKLNIPSEVSKVIDQVNSKVEVEKEIDTIIKRILAKDTTVTNVEIGKLMSDNSILAAENNQKYLQELFKLTKEKLSTKAEVQKVVSDVNTKVNVENEIDTIIKRILAKDTTVTNVEIGKLMSDNSILAAENNQKYLQELFKLTKEKLSTKAEVQKVVSDVNTKVSVESEKQAVIKKILAKDKGVTIGEIGKLLDSSGSLVNENLEGYLEELFKLTEEKLNIPSEVSKVIDQVNSKVEVEKEIDTIIKKILAKDITVTNAEIGKLMSDNSILAAENNQKYLEELFKLTKEKLSTKAEVQKVVSDVNTKVSVENAKQAVIKKILAKDKGVTINEIGKLLDSSGSLVNEHLEGYLEELFKLTEEKLNIPSEVSKVIDQVNSKVEVEKEIDTIIKKILAKDTTVTNAEIGKLMSDNSILVDENNQNYLEELFKLTKEKLSTKAEVQKVIADVNTKVNVEKEIDTIIKKILAKDTTVTNGEIGKLMSDNSILAAENNQKYLEELFKLTKEKLSTKAEVQKVVSDVNTKVNVEKEIDTIIKKILAKDTTVTNGEIGKLMSDNSILVDENNQNYLEELFKLTKEKLSTKTEVQKVITDVNTKVNVEKEKEDIINRIINKDYSVTNIDIGKLMTDTSILETAYNKIYIDGLSKLSKKELLISTTVQAKIVQLNAEADEIIKVQTIEEKIRKYPMKVTTKDLNDYLGVNSIVNSSAVYLDVYRPILDDITEVNKETVTKAVTQGNAMQKINESLNNLKGNMMNLFDIKYSYTDSSKWGSAASLTKKDIMDALNDSNKSIVNESGVNIERVKYMIAGYKKKKSLLESDLIKIIKSSKSFDELYGLATKKDEISVPGDWWTSTVYSWDMEREPVVALGGAEGTDIIEDAVNRYKFYMSLAINENTNHYGNNGNISEIKKMMISVKEKVEELINRGNTEEKLSDNRVKDAIRDVNYYSALPGLTLDQANTTMKSITSILNGLSFITNNLKVKMNDDFSLEAVNIKTSMFDRYTTVTYYHNGTAFKTDKIYSMKEDQTVACKSVFQDHYINQMSEGNSGDHTYYATFSVKDGYKNVWNYTSNEIIKTIK